MLIHMPILLHPITTDVQTCNLAQHDHEMEFNIYILYFIFSLYCHAEQCLLKSWIEPMLPWKKSLRKQLINSCMCQQLQTYGLPTTRAFWMLQSIGSIRRRCNGRKLPSPVVGSEVDTHLTQLHPNSRIFFPSMDHLQTK